MTATASAETIWAERVRAWRESGEPATRFVRGKGFAAGTLRYWASRLSQSERAPRIVPLVPKPTAPSSELVIEIGAARVRVGRGFDRALLAEVVSALGGSR